jgi:outer membrane protein OmpA-like peptidoglycan-associated protein
MFVAKQIEAPKSKEVETPVIAINPNFPIEKNKNSKNISPLLPKNETEEKELNSSKKETKNQIEEDLIVIQKRIDRDIEKINEAIKDKKKITLNSINFETNSPFLLRESYPTLNALSDILLKNPDITQEEIGKQLGIKQSGVSRRWNRANVNEILEVEKMYRNKIKSLLQ